LVILTINQSRWLAPFVALLFGNLTRLCMRMEARGLKVQCELTNLAAV